MAQTLKVRKDDTVEIIKGKDAGEQSLELELRRRRARTVAERAAVPAPPGPTFARRPSSSYR